MLDRRSLIQAAAAGATTLGVASAESKPIASSGGPWPLRDSDSYDFDSRAVGDRMAIGVWSPEAFLKTRGAPDDPSRKYDLVYVLDGSWALALAMSIGMLQLVDQVKPGFPPLIFVGVDYPVGAPNARTRDYTMKDSVPAELQAMLGDAPERTPGGADNFLKFLETELDPFIRSKYPVSERPAGLLGDSHGGTFSFYAFLKQSAIFDRYWLGSPGIFTTGTDYVAQFADLIAGKLIHDTKMYLSLGALEANGGFALYEDMGRHFNRIVSALNTKPNERLTWDSKVYPGHTHTTVVAPALNDALLYLYGPHQP